MARRNCWLALQFNIGGKLGTTLFAPFVGTIDRVSGLIGLSLAPFVPITMIAASSGTTHFKIISAGAAIDFEAETFEVTTSENCYFTVGCYFDRPN